MLMFLSAAKLNRTVHCKETPSDWQKVDIRWMKRSGTVYLFYIKPYYRFTHSAENSSPVVFKTSAFALQPEKAFFLLSH
jgi:hypothetical protein